MNIGFRPLNDTLTITFTDDLQKAIFLDSLERMHRELVELKSQFAAPAIKSVIDQVHDNKNWIIKEVDNGRT